MSNIFLLSWDNMGLEACINVSSLEKQKVWNLLQDKKNSGTDIGQLLHSLIMRARYNSQRHYEIYTIEVQPGITEDDIKEMFRADPQYSADLIRVRGNKIYSDRLDKTKVLIS